ncbi:MAG: endonuclease/exonuclease/phosphatase family protein [Candidatus Aminicenantes bacterium]|nr:MAG: endonuclease/exonuclease/phosphatase family protein [Candidatus Aminicenantes bacterium]
MKKQTLWFAFLISLVFVSFISIKGFQLLSQRHMPPPTLNIVSFNIRYDNPGDRENAWINRKDMAAETIRFHGIDIAGLQEALHSQVEDLEARLSEYGWFGVGRDDGQRQGEYTPIFYLKSRFKVLDQSTFWLSETPEVPGKLGWDAVCPRIVTWGKFKDRSTGKVLFVFNTHFDHVGEVARSQSADLILLKIEELAGSYPVVLTGDFNCTIDDAPYSILISKREGRHSLADTHNISRTIPYGSTQTFNGFNNELRPDFRIDFIFVCNISQVFRYGVISERWDGRFVSDHYPVMAEMSLSE